MLALVWCYFGVTSLLLWCFFSAQLSGAVWPAGATGAGGCSGAKEVTKSHACALLLIALLLVVALLLAIF